MKAEEQTQSYAQAIYQAALEGWLKTLGSVRDALDQDPALLERLGQADTAFAERQATLDGLIPAEASQELKNLLYAMLRDDHLGLLGDVLNHLERLLVKGPGVEVATVTSAVELAQDQADQFRQKLQSLYGTHLEVDFRVDPAILGGVVIQVGDKVLDGSVASKLDSLRDRLAMR
ncbi:MAG: ATP synthase F1 subunit delta, partial [Anaerolineae bacterium]